LPVSWTCYETVMNESDVEQTILAFLRKRVAMELPSANVI
jgi:hypothetical protein